MNKKEYIRNTKRKMLSLLLTAALVLMLIPSETVTAAYSFLGSGTSSTDPYIITTKAQLDELASAVNDGNDFGGCYLELGNNITFSGSWTPIGNLYCSFGGTFDGNGYTISGLSIGSNTQYNSSFSYAGLFGNVSTSATIKNLNLSVSIYSEASSSTIGALAGYSDGKIVNCTSSGIISASGTYVGGLIGYVNSGSIIGSSSSCAVTNTDDGAYVGGLIGESLGVAVNSYAAGNVTAGNSGYVGGFAGQNYSALSCYSTGTITVNGSMSNTLAVGGFTGIDAGGYVFNCYSSGSVSVSTLTSLSEHTLYIGGFDGIEQAAYMSNSFSSISTITTPSDSTNITVNAGRFTGELAGNYTNCYDNNSLSFSANGSSAGTTYTGSATALSTAVFGGTAASIFFTTDGSSTATASSLVTALNGGRAAFLSSGTSPSAILGSSPFSGYTPMFWENGTAGHPICSSLAKIAVTSTSASLGLASPFGGDNASIAIYKANDATASSGTDITSDANTMILSSGDAVTISNLNSAEIYYYYVIFTNSSGDIYTSEVVSVETTPALNHAPTLSVTPLTGLTLLYGASNGSQLFTKVTAGIGAGDGSGSGIQHFSSITLQVTGIQDGSDECLTIDSYDVYLYQSGTTTNTYTTQNGFSVTVTNASGTSATVTLSKASTVLSDWDTMIESIKYFNKKCIVGNPKLGTRTVKITAIMDDGGTLNGGTDSGTCSYKSDVTIVYGITYVLGINGATNSALNPSMYDSTANIYLVAPSANSYTFEGWYTSNTFTSAYLVSSPAIAKGATGNYTFYARWYNTVSFDTGSGTVVTSQSVATGGYATKPVNDPTYDGYIFGGWYTNSDYETKFDFTTTTITMNTTIYAKWTTITTESVTVKTAPAKTTYTEGETLDLTGLVVTLNKSNSTTENVAFADFTAKGITTSPANGTELSTGDTAVTITYTADSKSVIQSITVNPAPVVNSATISPTGINYDLSSPADVVTTITWNSASTVTDVVYGTTSLATPDVYAVSGSALTIKSSYINTLGISEGDVVTFKISFDKGTSVTLTVSIVDSYIPAGNYSITLQSGGNGIVSANIYSASKGTEIILTTTSDSGYHFKEWQVMDGGVTITDNKFTMPDNNVTVKAIFELIPASTYQVTINGSYTDASGAGSYSSGNIVTVNAGSRDRYTFNGWTSTDGITFSNANNATTTFIMPAGNVTVTASWSYSGSSGGSLSEGGNAGSIDGSTSDDSDTTEVQQEIKPDQPTIESATVKAKKETDNSAVAEIPEKTVANAIAKAQAEAAEQEKAENGIGVSLSVSSPVGTKSLRIVLTQPALTLLAKAEVSSLEIDSGLGSLNFDLEAIKEIQKQSTGAVTISFIPATSLNNDVKALVGTRPVYNISISYGKDGKTASITTLGSGSITLSLPYTPGKNEAVGCLFGVYVDGKGNATRIEGSTYDENSKSIIFDSDHFSVYGVGYTAPSKKFKDISSHWAKESIDYVVGRGLFSGTSTTAFSPEAAMSRGMLVTALGRLTGVDISDYKTVSFTDVAADKYYSPYIEWAYKNGIVSDIGNRQFAPDRAITREEIALILSNYAKATGYTLPVTREAAAFADDSNIGSTYKEAVKALQQAGIMMGGSGNKINPKANVTRAEVAAMLHRYIKLTIDPATAQGWAVNDAGQRLYYKDGKALTGWQTITSGDQIKKYYFTVEAIMVSSKWLKIDGNWYYFYKDGSLAVNTKVDGYKLDENGVRQSK